MGRGKPRIRLEDKIERIGQQIRKGIGRDLEKCMK
jgi:hypothetical protein